jgi:hypothetical protein
VLPPDLIFLAFTLINFSASEKYIHYGCTEHCITVIPDNDCIEIFSIDMLVVSGLFMVEMRGIQRVLTRKKPLKNIKELDA